MTKIVLDAESFKALASDTRLQILKALDARPLTVSELSRLLDLNKATVFEHLKNLMTAELAKREEDPARKWVYYKLTWKGRNILHPENVQIFVLLSLGALGVGGALFQTVAWARHFFGASDTSETLPDNADINRNRADAPAADGPSAQGNPSQEAQPVMAPPPESEDSTVASPPWYERLWEGDALLAAGLILFVALLGLLAWTLVAGQRRERIRLRRLVDALPDDVNAGEESVV